MSELRAIFRGGPDAETGGGRAWEALAAEFPAVGIHRGGMLLSRGIPCLPALPAEEWESQNFNFWALDAQVNALAERDGGGPFALVLLGGREELPRVAREILTRCQRWMDRRNESSSGPLFDRALAAHREAHDLGKPLVRADYDHALDTWQWVLRLSPEAGLAVQLAALFHDFERLVSEADARVEHRSPDYQAFKDRHAERGAELADAVLQRVGIDEAARRRTARLIARHESPDPDDPDAGGLALLNDADALSFFSLNSAGYLDYFGPGQTRRKVAYTARRLRPGTRRHLEGLRLRPLVAEALAGERAA
ncbi:MAG: DUF4202 family protein [Thermoanaerobaculia bacterium]